MLIIAAFAPAAAPHTVYGSTPPLTQTATLQVSGLAYDGTPDAPTARPAPVIPGLPTPTPDAEVHATGGAVTPLAATATAGALSAAQLDALLAEVGFPPATWPQWRCTAERESHWHPGSHNVNPDTKDDSVGLVQINLYGNLLEGRLRQLRSLGYDVQTRDDAVAVLKDPRANLRMAYLLSGGGYQLGPWTGACGA